MKDFQSHFGLHTLPFTREISVDKQFVTPFFTETVDALKHTVERRMSGAVMGVAGSGKTAGVRKLVSLLPEARYEVHYIKVTDLSRRDMCREMAAVMGVAPAGSYPMLVRRLQDRFLNTNETDGLRPVVIIDDAHEVRPDVLGLLNVLTNFEMDSRLVVSVILVGQPPLKKLLRRDELEDVAGRLAHVATLRLLSREEARDYIKHRVNVAGARSMPFDDPSLEAIYELARGNLRATDSLALKTLEIAHKAGCKVADSNHVAEARKQLWP